MNALLQENVPQREAGPTRYVQVRLPEDVYQKLRRTTFDLEVSFQEFAFDAITTKLDQYSGGEKNEIADE